MDYKFKINDFEGPLDLLLHLIKESKMDIFNIEIVSLTNQYLDFISHMEELNLSIASSYLVMASELMYMKSNYLLPRPEKEDEDEIDAKEELINRLIEYKKYKETTPILKQLEEERKDLFTKSTSSLKEFKSDEIKLGEDVTLDDLLKAFSKFLERKNYEKPISTKVTTKEISVEERTYQVRNILKLRKKVEFFDLFENYSKPYVVVTFLSILEMAKNNELKIIQENNFDKIYCEAGVNL